MGRDGILKHALIVFVLATAVYAVVFIFVEGRRTRQGPWVVTFHEQGGRVDALRIDEAGLGFTNIVIRLADPAEPTGETNHVVVFDQPRVVPFPVPGGECVFLDLLFQPGTVTLELGQPPRQVQLLPRTLSIDGEEVAWTANSVHDARRVEE